MRNKLGLSDPLSLGFRAVGSNSQQEQPSRILARD